MLHLDLVSRIAGGVCLSLLTCIGVAIPTGAFSASPSGTVIAVVQSTTASGPGGNRTLSEEKPIFSGDRIKTGDIGNAQLRFLDDTRFVIGPRSSVVIDKFVFNPDQSLAGASIQMTRGAFRFISGVGPKKAYRIVTPSATLGIRGTEVDVAVGRNLGTAILVFSGAVQLCSRRSGQCRIVRSGCGAAVSAPDGSLRSPRTRSAKVELIETSFPLIEQQGRLRRPFRVNTRGCDQVSDVQRSGGNDGGMGGPGGGGGGDSGEGGGDSGEGGGESGEGGGDGRG